MKDTYFLDKKWIDNFCLNLSEMSDDVIQMEIEGRIEEALEQQKQKYEDEIIKLTEQIEEYQKHE